VVPDSCNGFANILFQGLVVVTMTLPNYCQPLKKYDLIYRRSCLFSYKMSKKVKYSVRTLLFLFGQVVEGVETFSGISEIRLYQRKPQLRSYDSNGTI